MARWLGYPARPLRSARSSADQSIGLRSQGSWVRIPPGAPPCRFCRIAPSPPEPTMKRISFVTALIASIAFCASAFAQQYPTKSITMLVPYAAGGPTDTVARVAALSMSKPLGQTVLVENKPSAGGILAPEQAKNSKPDGYTILIHHVGMATTPALYRQLRFNPLTDFDYIGLINDVPMTLIANEKVPAKSFKEFLDYIKKN